MIPLAFVLAVVGGTVGIGIWGIRLARTTSDLYVASRAISPWWNAAAISGEYLSAASFLGIAGLTMKLGAEALWLPLGFTAGYLALLLFVAAPLRRYGSYTISDFAEARLERRWMRLLSATIVLGVGLLYLVPQLKGAGITVRSLTGAPYWAGVAVIGVVVALSVGLGGMRGVTYVQAYQFWVKLLAIALPAVVLLIVLRGLPERDVLFGDSVPRTERAISVELKAARTLTFAVPTQYRIDGRAEAAGAGEERTVGPGRFELAKGAAVPSSSGRPEVGREWARPVGESSTSSLLYVYSLLIATFFGTMGLPHILVRFYTNPDGRAARQTTVHVLGLLGLFYTFPVVYGALGRVLVPELGITGETDAVVLRLPEIAWPGLGGEILSGVVAAGAFAAFMSTASGLLVSVAGTLSYDVWPRLRHASSTGRTAERRRRFRVASVIGILVPMALALVVRRVDIGVLVGWAFALAASTFCPLFVLGIWWSGLTARGAAVGMAVGGGIASAAITTALVSDSDAALLAQPALVSVPAAFAAMVAFSLLGREHPAAAGHMLALHAPEGLGLEAYRRGERL